MDVAASQQWTYSHTSSIFGAVSQTDGAKNTDAIVVHSSCIFNLYTTERCAAYNCRNNYTEGGYTNWYLPAICEMGKGSVALCTGNAGNPSQQNMQENLVDAPSVPGAPSGGYWSSTWAGGPQQFAFRQIFCIYNSNASAFKTGKYGVRCSRALSL